MSITANVNVNRAMLAFAVAVSQATSVHHKVAERVYSFAMLEIKCLYTLYNCLKWLQAC